MKFRIIEFKNEYGEIRYKIQYRFLNFLWWRDYKTPSITFYFPPFSELVDCALSHREYDHKKDEKYRSLYYSPFEYYRIEGAKDDLKRFQTIYEYKGVRIYPAHFNQFYVLNWGYAERFDIFGSYEECCEGIDRKFRQIEEYKQARLSEQEKENKRKEYKKHKSVVEYINK